MRNQILVGDVRETLRQVPSESVHTCITSPPYWALRDYGNDLQLGSESTPSQYIANQVAVFEEVKRVLRADGTLWVNLGDTYSSAGKHGGKSGSKNNGSTFPRMTKQRGDDRSAGNRLLIPERFALAMQDAGWRLRQTVIWHKPAPMPESLSGWEWRRCRVKVACATNYDAGKNAEHIDRRKVGFNSRYKHPDEHAARFTDCAGCDKCRATNGFILKRGAWRPTTSHEVLYLFSKSDRYFCDSMAVAEPTTGNAHSRGSGLNQKVRLNPETSARQNASFSGAVAGLVSTRNPRSVWTIAAEPYKGAHFATFPTELPRRCIVASTSAAGCCPMCGSQWAPIVQSARVPTRPGHDTKCRSASGAMLADNVIGNKDPLRHETTRAAVGYLPTCRCDPLADGDPASLNGGYQPVPAIVLDIYAGSGTTLQVAHQLGRDWLGCELNEEYVSQIRERIKLPLKRRDGTSKRRKRQPVQQKELFTT